MPSRQAAMPVRVQPFVPVFAEGVVDVILPIQQGEFGIPITLAQQPDLLDIDGTYRRGRGNFWVATHNDVVVGTLGLIDIGDGCAALRKMFVAAPYRGREHAVAKRLLDTLLAWSRVQGLTGLFLGTTEKFLAAHRFYEKHGFSQIDRRELPASFPVMAVDSKFYRLNLAANR